jgi:hypothetical protein
MGMRTLANLPAPLSSFVGRAHELTEIAQCLAWPTLLHVISEVVRSLMAQGTERVSVMPEIVAVEDGLCGCGGELADGGAERGEDGGGGDAAGGGELVAVGVTDLVD